jgi:Mg2+ and Co2+ transporter CorA
MIRHLLFEDGKVAKGSGLNYQVPGRNSYLFLFLEDATPKEVKKVSSDFGFDPEPLRTFKKETHSRRYLTKPFQFLLRSCFLQNSNSIGYANLLFVPTNNALIVSSSKHYSYYDELLDDLGESLDGVQVRSIGHVLYNFLQEDVDENYEVLGLLEQRTKELGIRATRLNLRNTRVSVEAILALKRQIFRLSRQFWATTRVLSLIRIGVAQVRIDKESARLLGDVHETFLHQIDLAAAQKEMVNDTLSVYSTSISNRQAVTSNELNTVVKRLTAYSIILLVPTLITGIYGMNFAYLPLADKQWGIYAMFGILFSIMGVIFFYAKRNDWL